MPRSSPLCLDASVVIRRLTEPGNRLVHEHWDAWEAMGCQLVAPHLIRYEVTNAIHRLRQARALSNGAARDAMSLLLEMPIGLHFEEELHRGALDFAERFHLPAAYDAHYLALANRLGAELWTADRRLANTVQRHLPWVQLVGQ